MKNIIYFDTEIGRLGAVDSDGKIIRVLFDGQTYEGDAIENETETLLDAKRQIREYLAGERREFSVEIAPAGTDFQRKCWDALCDIPYGQTRAYSEIAAAIGNPKACRAVGLANNKNPIPIVIPCHRVIGKNGGLTGFGGGLGVKERLLRLENDSM